MPQAICRPNGSTLSENMQTLPHVDERGSLMVTLIGVDGVPSRVGEDNQLIIGNVESILNVMSRFRKSGIGATAWACLIDLSDDTNWPHDGTGRIDISRLSIRVDKAANTVGSVRVGVVTRVSATDGDVSMFADLSFTNSSGTNVELVDNYSPSQLKLGVTGGATTQFVTNSPFLAQTAIQNDVAMESYRGAATVTPAVGDVVILFEHTSGIAYTATVKVNYHAEATA